MLPSRKIATPGGRGPSLPSCVSASRPCPHPRRGSDRTKPFREEDLTGAIHAAIAQDRDARRKRAESAELRQRLSSLTPREREVLPLVVSGLLNKQAAAELGISEVTLQIHRGNIMKKMGAGSLAELVRMAGMLEIPMTYSRRAQ